MILVCGGAGYIGSHMVYDLINVVKKFLSSTTFKQDIGMPFIHKPSFCKVI